MLLEIEMIADPTFFNPNMPDFMSPKETFKRYVNVFCIASFYNDCGYTKIAMNNGDRYIANGNIVQDIRQAFENFLNK